jgi:hypothetical protein
MKNSLLLIVCAIGCFVSSESWGQNAAGGQDAAEVAKAVIEAMGGQEALESIHLLQFDFVVSRDGQELSRRKHWWDRRSGDYRLEGVTREEKEPYRVIFNVHSKEGRAWQGSEELAGEELAKELENAYGRFINDTYWLLMPWKWLDPGVHLTREEERSIDGKAFDVVKLDFDDGTGLTSGDIYRGYVSQDTGLMERWEYVLQTEDGSPGDQEPTVWDWTDWKELDAGVKVSVAKRRVAGESDGPEVIIGTPVHRADADVSDEEMQELMHPATSLAEEK